MNLLVFQLLKSVHAYDPMIERLPRMEQELSRLLNDIRIERRQKREFVMAQNYEVLLNKMLNSLRRCQGVARHKLGDQDLSHLVMVVEWLVFFSYLSLVVEFVIWLIFRLREST